MLHLLRELDELVIFNEINSRSVCVWCVRQINTPRSSTDEKRRTQFNPNLILILSRKNSSVHRRLVRGDSPFSSPLTWSDRWEEARRKSIVRPRRSSWGSFRGRINARQIKPEFLRRCATLNRFVNSGVCSSECKTYLAEVYRGEHYTILTAPRCIAASRFPKI